jgi:hypothetical protein
MAATRSPAAVAGPQRDYLGSVAGAAVRPGGRVCNGCY